MEIRHSVTEYKELTLEKMKEYLAVSAAPTNENREFTLVTGRARMEMFNHAMSSEVVKMEKKNNHENVIFLEEKGSITKHEADRLRMMIDSEGPEDYDLAKAIIAEKMTVVYKQSMQLSKMIESPDKESNNLAMVVLKQLTDGKKEKNR